MKYLKTLTLTLGLLWPSLNFAGGGWIANGLDGESHFSSESEETLYDSDQNRDTNYFLLKEGEMSLTLGSVWYPEVQTSADQTQITHYEQGVGILYSWGFAKNWTWSNYLNLLVGLYSRGRNDIALSFGPSNGLGWDEASGFYMNPGISLLHSFYLGAGFRLTDITSVSGSFQSRRDQDGSRFGFDAAQLRLQVSKNLGSWARVYVGAKSYIGYRRQTIDNRIHKSFEKYFVAAEPHFGIDLFLGTHASLGLSIFTDHKSLKRAGGPTTMLDLTTNF